MSTWFDENIGRTTPKKSLYLSFFASFTAHYLDDADPDRDNACFDSFSDGVRPSGTDTLEIYVWGFGLRGAKFLDGEETDAE